MTSLLNANLPSDDEEDNDYDPTKDKTGSDDEKKARKLAAGVFRGRIPIKAQTPPEVAVGGKRSREAELKDEPTSSAQDALKKSKVSDIWAQLKQKAGAVPTGKATNPSCETANQGVVRTTPVQAVVQTTPKAVPEFVVNESTTAASTDETDRRSTLTSLAAHAIAAAKAATSAKAAQQHGQVAVVETRKFAGKDIQVTKTVSAADAAAAAAAKKKAGLDAVLASLQSAKKINILDKTRSDWNGFKKANTEVEDELEAHQRGGSKYLDKVDFLKRAEVREYEQERDKRLASNVNTRGRL